ncbi:MAG TPA: hypothetical protein VFY56_09520 [Propionibacteriaceae bacterium]|nr:hypothetical protein [Propionibacteriaceae bacterium]
MRSLVEKSLQGVERGEVGVDPHQATAGYKLSVGCWVVRCVRHNPLAVFGEQSDDAIPQLPGRFTFQSLRAYVGKRLTLGLADVEDMLDFEASNDRNRRTLSGILVLGLLLSTQRGEDLDTCLALSYLSAKRLPRPVAR